MAAEPDRGAEPDDDVCGVHFREQPSEQSESILTLVGITRLIMSGPADVHPRKLLSFAGIVEGFRISLHISQCHRSTCSRPPSPTRRLLVQSRWSDVICFRVHNRALSHHTLDDLLHCRMNLPPYPSPRAFTPLCLCGSSARRIIQDWVAWRGRQYTVTICPSYSDLEINL